MPKNANGLMMVGDRQKTSIYDMMDKYRKCQLLYLVDSLDDVPSNEGYLYCVSTSPDTYKDIQHLRSILTKEGKICVMGGSYENGGGVGLQYEYTE